MNPRVTATVLRPVPNRLTTAWETGRHTSLWVVRFDDGREAVIDPSLACVGPIDRQLNLLHLAFRDLTPRTMGGLSADATAG